MYPFAVTVDDELLKTGETDGKKDGLWVLAVDGERLLLAHSDGSLHWHDMANCRFFKFRPPDAPVPVIPLATAQSGLALPNRAERRRIARDGGC